ncbi:MAG TPA: hypothetical protein VF661_13975 [Actinomycetales bacterium]|jgi:hypothetical protein
MHGTRGHAAPARTTTPVRTGRSRALVPLLLAVTLLGGCSGSTDPVVSATDATVPAPTVSSPTTPAATDDTGTTPAAPSSTTPTTAAPTPTSATTTTAATPSTTRTTAPPARPTTSATEVEGPPGASWPKALGEPRQGDPVWAVYLVTAGSSSDPAIEGSVQQAASVGYQAVVGDLACDQGAVEALGLDPYDLWSAATVYFPTERDANDFVASYRAEVGDVAGYTRVTLGCLD